MTINSHVGAPTDRPTDRPADGLPGAELSSAHHGRGEKLCVWPDTVNNPRPRFDSRVSTANPAPFTQQRFSLSRSLPRDWSQTSAEIRHDILAHVPE